MVVGGFALPPTSDAAQRARCKPKGAKTIVATRDARIFSIDKCGNEEWFYGCALPRGKPYRLSRLNEDGVYLMGGAVTPPRLLGRRVAFVLERYRDGPVPPGQQESSPGPLLRVVDLRRGRRLANIALPADTYVSDFEARSPGQLAWLQRTNPLSPGASTISVYAYRRGARELLDSGTEIPPDSLALGGSSIYWMNAGQPRAAQLD